MWITLFIIILFTFLAFLMAFLPGLLSKVLAIPCFIFCMPLIAGKWTIIGDSTGSIIQISLPAVIIGSMGFIWTIFIYWSTINVIEFLDRETKPGRDFGRKKGAK